MICCFGITQNPKTAFMIMKELVSCARVKNVVFHSYFFRICGIFTEYCSTNNMDMKILENKSKKTKKK